MSLIYKCDVCGKDSAMTNVAFSNGPMFVKKKNYDNKEVRIFLNIIIEDESDFQRLVDIKNKVAKLQGLQQLEEMSDEEEDTLEQMEQEVITVELENPYPMICNQCKKHLADDLLSSAEFPVERPAYSTTSARMTGIQNFLSNDK